MSFGIYAISFPDNNIYIGSTIQSFRKRWTAHHKAIYAGNHSNFRINQCVKKYGADAAVFTIVEECRDQSVVIEREKYWIEYYGPTHVVLNVAVPGEFEGSGVKSQRLKAMKSKEVRAKISKTMKDVRRGKVAPKTVNKRGKKNNMKEIMEGRYGKK